jgi:hypothetical protein
VTTRLLVIIVGILSLAIPAAADDRFFDSSGENAARSSVSSA